MKVVELVQKTLGMCLCGVWVAIYSQKYRIGTSHFPFETNTCLVGDFPFWQKGSWIPYDELTHNLVINRTLLQQ